MKNVFIHAYAAGNLGDDLLIRILCERYPAVRFKICADESYKERFRDISNLAVYSPSDMIVRLVDKAAAKLKKADRGFWKYLIKHSFATVHIGGSVFVQHQDDFGPAYRLDEELCARSNRIFVVGANFGPYTDEQYFKQYYELFKQYEGISFRDRYSYELFQELPNVTYAPDVVFNYHINAETPKKQVLMSVIALHDRTGKFGISQYESSYKKFMSELVQEYVSRGYHIKFVSFCRFQGDETAIREILSQAGLQDSDKVSVCAYDCCLEECMKCFAESEIIVGTRFHSVVLGWLAGKKVLPIVYDVKTRRLLKDNQCPFYLELDDLNQDAAAAARKMDGIGAVDVQKLIREAEGQFKALDKALM